MRTRLLPWIAVAVSFAVLSGTAAAQSQGGGSTAPPTTGRGERGTPPGGSTPDRPNTPDRVPNTAPFPQQSPEEQPAPQFERPQYVTGKVILDDGSPAPPNTMIERVCNGTPRPETYTDPKGNFSFEVGGPPRGFVPDASYSGSSAQIGFGTPGDRSSMAGVGLSPRNSLFGCEVRASLPGFRSDAFSIADRGGFSFNIDVGTIVLHRIAEVRGYTISITTAMAPKSAQRAYEDGVRRARNERWDRAETQLRQAVEEYPRYAVAWQALGEVLEAQQRPAEARAAYDKALEADGSFLSPHLSIAVLAARESDWQEMAAASSQVIRLNPYDFPEAYYFQSVAKANLNDLEGAESAAREAIERHAEQRFPHVEYVLGTVLADKGELAEASEHLKKYLEISPDGRDAESVRGRLAEIDRHLSGQTLP